MSFEQSHAPSRRSFLGLTAAGSLAVLLSSCAVDPKTLEADPAAGTATSAAIVEGGTLRLAFTSDVYGNLDPNQNFWIESRSINRNLVDSLTDQDPKTGEIVPWLATKWEVAPDAKSYTFDLRDDVTFSDGTKFDATAVKTALDGIKALGAKASLGATYISGYAGTTVLSPTRVRVDFSTPNAAFLQATATTTLGILSPASYSKTPEARAKGDYVGSGPFTLTEYVQQQSIKLAKRADYAWGSGINANTGAAHIDALEVTFIPEEGVLTGSLTSGQIDVAWPRTPLSEAAQTSVKAAGATVLSAVLPGLTYNIIPNVNGILGDPAVRQALQKALDRAEWASTVFYDGYPVAKSVIDSTTPQWADNSSLLEHDPTGAKALLDQAGWVAGSDGTRSKDGKPLSLTLVVGGPWAGWDLVQSQLGEVGITLVQRVVTPAEFTTASNSGDFDLTATYFTRGDADILRTYYDQSVVKPGTGPGAYNQEPQTAAQLTTLFAQEISETDPVKRKAVFADIQKILISSGALFPLQDRVQTAATAATVHDLKFTLESFLRLNDVWISK
ncbi:peptide/nickel transport system substrate-binding protein [Quadrisphaera granulorum]|uniref:Peptide/nickel transport system substrate-binding protein n=1 Tax=Quadrisphaera granulorum TaxID=317664 RepID=A0A316AEU8_9ACTN|nr:ABC transporter substrate-binding protein [Quadrisphaera granulorum]PWJ48307.1 peptide/nickel transport system substrate-binding protein [Quadrisphaera granulorum]SZE98468.1 peptide/nickel transport system substrate-binding protein [Quadrisphaera granulorum]